MGLRRICLTILVAATQALAHVVVAQDEPQYKTYLTRQVIDNEPAMEADSIFDCTDRIYVVLEALRLPQKNTQLMVRWFNPTGEQQERTVFDFNAQPFTRVWAWLQLNGPPGAVIGQVFDPSFGMEDFIGDWEAKVFLDKKPVETIGFQVIC